MRVGILAAFVVLALVVVLRPLSKPAVIVGKWTLDPKLSRVVVPEGATDFPYLQFAADGSLLYVVGGARLSAKYEVNGDTVKVTPSEFDAPIFFGIDGSETSAGKVVVWKLVSEDKLEWRQQGGNGLLYFVRE